MRAAATSVWGLLGAAAALTLTLHAGCTNQSVERRGGGEIPDLTAGTVASREDPGSALEAGAGGALGESAASGEAGAAGAVSAPVVTPPVTWCAAYQVIACVCQQCHQNPAVHQAPFPIVTYADTQLPHPSAGSKKKLWQEMQRVVASGYMPYRGVEDPPVAPPVQPLSAENKATLLTWFSEGAHDEGGQACPQACDWSTGAP